MQIQKFYSNGKLLLTGEYLVLDGVQALAVPTRFGQSMEVTETDTSVIHWTNYDHDGSVWMQEEVTIDEIINSDSENTTTFRGVLINVLRAAHKQNKVLLATAKGFDIKCELTFPRIWGLGTSSTWINNVAEWFDINGFQLLEESFGGSGYDIACAQHDTPIFYRRNGNSPEITEVTFIPNFIDQLYFVYLNQKQSSKEAIANYRKKKNGLGEVSKRIEAIGIEMQQCTNFTVFCELITEHELLMSAVLEQETVKQRLFADFDGEVKSLGAWGGDFVLVAASENPTVYFEDRGYHTILSYKKMINYQK